MTDNIITPEFRAAFVGLFRPTAPKENPNGAKKFSIRAVFMPDTDLTLLKQEAESAAKEGFPAGIPKVFRSPFRTNAELENPIPGIPDDAIVMTFSASENRRPGVVDKNLQDIIDESEVYAGAWYRAQIRAYAYGNKPGSSNKGVSFGLQNVQKTKEDEPLGRGKVPASKAFESFGSGKSAGNLFD